MVKEQRERVCIYMIYTDQQSYKSINKIQTSLKKRAGMTKGKTEKSTEDKTVTWPKIQIRRKLVTEQTMLNIQYFKHYL